MNKLINKKQLGWLIITLCYMIFIWIQSELFNPQLIERYAYEIDLPVLLTFGIVFELLHLIEFGILFILLIQVLKANPHFRLTKSSLIVCIVISLMYGVMDEFHQLYVPHRSFSFIDILKNSFGVFIAYYIVRRKYKWK